MKEYALDFAYNEMTMIKDLARKKLDEICIKKGINTVHFYCKFLDAYKAGTMDIVPCVEEYILASIVRRCDEMEQTIKKDLNLISGR